MLHEKHDEPVESVDKVISLHEEIGVWVGDDVGQVAVAWDAPGRRPIETQGDRHAIDNEMLKKLDVGLAVEAGGHRRKGEVRRAHIGFLVELLLGLPNNELADDAQEVDIVEGLHRQLVLQRVHVHRARCERC